MNQHHRGSCAFRSQTVVAVRGGCFSTGGLQVPLAGHNHYNNLVLHNQQPVQRLGARHRSGVDQCESKQCRIRDEATRNHLQSCATHFTCIQSIVACPTAETTNPDPPCMEYLPTSTITQQNEPSTKPLIKQKQHGAYGK